MECLGHEIASEMISYYKIWDSLMASPEKEVLEAAQKMAKDFKTSLDKAKTFYAKCSEHAVSEAQEVLAKDLKKAKGLLLLLEKTYIWGACPPCTTPRNSGPRHTGFLGKAHPSGRAAAGVRILGRASFRQGLGSVNLVGKPSPRN